jgi:DEAD/DEAH box helicase domain-containing protein
MAYPSHRTEQPYLNHGLAAHLWRHGLAPRVVRIGTEAWPALQIADTLVNGSGLSRWLSQPAERPKVIELLKSMVSDMQAWPLKDFAEASHRVRCDQACYECMLRYGNRNYHGLLDWRLGLSFVRALLDPTYAAGADGHFKTPEMEDWLAMSANAFQRVARGSRYMEFIPNVPLPAAKVRRSGSEVVIAARHPLWSDGAGIMAPIINNMIETVGENLRWINSFDLARRPFPIIAKLSED